MRTAVLPPNGTFSKVGVDRCAITKPACPVAAIANRASGCRWYAAPVMSTKGKRQYRRKQKSWVRLPFVAAAPSSFFICSFRLKRLRFFEAVSYKALSLSLRERILLSIFRITSIKFYRPCPSGHRGPNPHGACKADRDTRRCSPSSPRHLRAGCRIGACCIASFPCLFRKAASSIEQHLD